MGSQPPELFPSTLTVEQLAAEIQRLRSLCPRCGLTMAECEHRGGHFSDKNSFTNGRRRFA